METQLKGNSLSEFAPLVAVDDFHDGGTDELTGAVEVSLRLEAFEIRGQLSV